MSNEPTQNTDRAERAGRNADSHDQPIIIDGTNSVTLMFDDDDDEHYVPDHRVNPTEYRGDRLKIGKVTVYVPDKAPHNCELPQDRKCSVVIQGKGASQEDDPIIIDGRTGTVIVIRPDSDYPKVVTGSKHKKHHAVGHKVESLKILNAAGGVIHPCPEIPKNGKCRIVIRDVHVP